MFSTSLSERNSVGWANFLSCGEEIDLMTVLLVGGLKVFRRDGVTAPELPPASIHGAAWKVNLTKQYVSGALATRLRQLPCGAF